MGTNFLNSIAICCFTCVANDCVVLGPAYQMFFVCYCLNVVHEHCLGEKLLCFFVNLFILNAVL